MAGALRAGREEHTPPQLDTPMNVMKESPAPVMRHVPFATRDEPSHRVRETDAVAARSARRRCCRRRVHHYFFLLAAGICACWTAWRMSGATRSGCSPLQHSSCRLLAVRVRYCGESKERSSGVGSRAASTVIWSGELLRQRSVARLRASQRRSMRGSNPTAHFASSRRTRTPGTWTGPAGLRLRAQAAGVSRSR